ADVPRKTQAWCDIVRVATRREVHVRQRPRILRLCTPLIPHPCLHVIAEPEIQRQIACRLPLVRHISGVGMTSHLPLEVGERCLKLCGAFQAREAEVRICGIEVLILTEGPGSEDVTGSPLVGREDLNAAAK